MAISDPGRGLVRCLGVTAAAVFALAAASHQRAEALSLASPGTAPSAKYATDGLTTEVQHRGHGGGGFRGGGGGGFRGGGFHGGGFGAAARRFMAEASEAAARHFTAAGSEAVRFTAVAFAPRRCSGVAVFARRRSSMAAAIATDIVTPITGPISITTGVTSIGASITRRPITGIPAIITATGTATAA